ncbi:hypothetical protein K9L16_02240 [Candidatus Pacearchaeota archaeon]|nr:hypothetical protein [Candidatus Pacearchaeota archaeon]
MDDKNSKLTEKITEFGRLLDEMGAINKGIASISSELIELYGRENFHKLAYAVNGFRFCLDKTQILKTINCFFCIWLRK